MRVLHASSARLTLSQPNFTVGENLFSGLQMWATHTGEGRVAGLHMVASEFFSLELLCNFPQWKHDS